jgi:hypothetical protein
MALLLIGLGALAVAPMFMYAMEGNSVGADLGSVGAIAVERLELLRVEEFNNLTAGGDLDNDVAGYSDTGDPDYVVRWTIANNATPPNTRLITVRVIAVREVVGEAKEVTLTTVRGR